VRVRVLDRDVDAQRRRVTLPEHDDARAERDLGMVDRALVIAIDDNARESRSRAASASAKRMNGKMFGA